MRLLVLFFLFISFSASAQDAMDCSKFKTGTFMIEEDPTTRIIRTKKFQTEKAHDMSLKMQVEWISDCKYKLIPIKTKSKGDSLPRMVLICDIIETGEDYYIVSISSEKNGFMLEVKMFLVK